MLNRIMHRGAGTIKNLTSGPNSPDIEIHFSPAIVPNPYTLGKPGEYGITMVCTSLYTYYYRIP